MDTTAIDFPKTTLYCDIKPSTHLTNAITNDMSLNRRAFSSFPF